MLTNKTSNGQEASSYISSFISSCPSTNPGQTRSPAEREAETPVDVLLINPPLPADKRFWRGGEPRLGWHSDSELTWPQTPLAQMAAMLAPDYKITVIDAVAQGLNWTALEMILAEIQPRYYVTQVRPETLQNDMVGVSLAQGGGAKTIAFGPYATALAQDILGNYAALDFVLHGEPELTLREVVDTLETAAARWSEGQAEPNTWSRLQKLFKATNPVWRPVWRLASDLDEQLQHVPGLVWRQSGETRRNPARPLIPDLDDLPLAYHHLLPLSRYRTSLHKTPYAFVITNRTDSLPGKQRANQQSVTVRLRTPQNIMTELWLLHDLGVGNVHMLADEFGLDREQVLGLGKLIIEEELSLRWTCTSRVEPMDEEMLSLMGRAGCCKIFWNIESITEQALKERNSYYRSLQAPQALGWAKKAGIQNCGCFTIGLPGETEASIKETITFAKELPLDLAHFKLPTPQADSSFYFKTLMNGNLPPNFRANGLKPDSQLRPEALAYWSDRAFQEWAWHARPMWSVISGVKNWLRGKDKVRWSPINQGAG